MKFPEVAHRLRYWLRQNNLDPDRYTIEIKAKTDDEMCRLRSSLASETQALYGTTLGVWEDQDDFLSTGEFRMMGLNFKITSVARWAQR